MDKRIEKIRLLNDLFRTCALGNGQLVITQGIQSLPKDLRERIYRRVMLFDEFTEDNDPRGEHDFGSFEFGAHTIFWKIDYYDETYTAHSDDESDPEITRRVLTIMLASEY